MLLRPSPFRTWFRFRNEWLPRWQNVVQQSHYTHSLMKSTSFLFHRQKKSLILYILNRNDHFGYSLPLLQNLCVPNFKFDREQTKEKKTADVPFPGTCLQNSIQGKSIMVAEVVRGMEKLPFRPLLEKHPLKNSRRRTRRSLSLKRSFRSLTREGSCVKIWRSLLSVVCTT